MDPAAIRDVATLIAAVAAAPVALAAASRVPVIRRPGQWLWRRLVAEPVTVWAHRTLDESPLGRRLEAVEHEVRTNDGSSLRDVADRTEAGMGRIEQRLADGDEHLASLDGQVAAVRSTLEEHLSD